MLVGSWWGKVLCAGSTSRAERRHSRGRCAVVRVPDCLTRATGCCFEKGACVPMHCSHLRLRGGKTYSHIGAVTGHAREIQRYGESLLCRHPCRLTQESLEVGINDTGVTPCAAPASSGHTSRAELSPMCLHTAALEAAMATRM